MGERKGVASAVLTIRRGFLAPERDLEESQERARESVASAVLTRGHQKGGRTYVTLSPTAALKLHRHNAHCASGPTNQKKAHDYDAFPLRDIGLVIANAQTVYFGCTLIHRISVSVGHKMEPIIYAKKRPSW